MKKQIYKSQDGIAHLGLLLLIIAVVGVIGFGAWRVVESNKSEPVEVSQEEIDAALDQIEDESTVISDNSGAEIDYTDQGAQNETF